jgi:hypothetical protein
MLGVSFSAIQQNPSLQPTTIQLPSNYQLKHIDDLETDASNN